MWLDLLKMEVVMKIMKIGLMMLAAVLMYQVNAFGFEVRFRCLIVGGEDKYVSIFDFSTDMTYRQLREKIAGELAKQGFLNYAIKRHVLPGGSILYGADMLDRKLDESFVDIVKSNGLTNIKLVEYDSVDHIPDELCSDLQMAKKLRSSWIRGGVITSQEKDLVLIERQLKDVFGYEYDRIVALTLKEKQAIIKTASITED